MRFLSSIITLLLLLGMVVGPSLAQSSVDPVPLAVIAHGVTPRPDGDVAWRVRPRRAPLPERGKGIMRPASFVLAEEGPVAIVALSGRVQSRLAPGEAVWLPPGLPAAVVSLEDLPVGYAQIELASAVELSGADWEQATATFTLPSRDEAFDLKLASGVVRLRDAITVDAGIAPGLLYVTGGVVGVEQDDGERVQLTAGSVLEVKDEVRLFGGSRQPATFVLASVAAAAPAELPLLNGVQATIAPVATGTPTVAPTSTPRPRPTIAPIPTATAIPSPTALPTPTAVPAGEAEVGITAAICPVAYAGSDYQADCLSPASDVEFMLSMGEDLVRTEVANASGEVTFEGLPADDYVIAAGVPGDFASSRVRCLDATGVDIARRAATNQIAVSLVPDDAIACDWFIVPDDARGEVDDPALTSQVQAAPEVSPTPEPEALIGSVSVHIRACPAEMTVDTLDPDACDVPPAGTTLSLLADDVPQGVFDVRPELWWWQNLPFGSFALVVNAIPEGFESASLGSRVCCDQGNGFEVYTSEETPDTGYFLFLYPTPSAAAEVEEQETETAVATATPEAPLDPFLAVDPDGDGVPTSDEDGFFGTDPGLIDTDGDGVSDTVEIAAGADPLVADTP